MWIGFCMLSRLLSNKDIKEVELDLTGTCNLSCPLCARNYNNQSDLILYNERPISDIINQLNAFPNLTDCCLAGIVSEPTLYKDFFKLIKYLVNRNIKIELYTNASIHTTSWWKELAKLLTQRDKVYFTICGSSQELHEKYRKGSNLQTIIDNAMAFKKSSKYNIDCIQYIIFEYNKNDYASIDTKKIIEKFSHNCSIDSLPYRERFNIKKSNTLEKTISMRQELSDKYAYISKYGKRALSSKKSLIKCKSFDDKFVAIDQFGKIYPCFLYRLYEKNINFNLNYEKIFNFDYDFCYECEKNTTAILEQNGLERMG